LIDTLAEDFNPNQLPRYPERYVYDNQEAFLTAYATCGNEAGSCKEASVSQRSIRAWKQGNVLQFNERIGMAFARFCHVLENKALSLVKDLSVTNSPLLLITLLNANMPHKYRPNVVVVDDTAKETLAALKDIAKGKDTKAAVETVETEVERILNATDKAT
jgi:hypothetical protein